MVQPIAAKERRRVVIENVTPEVDAGRFVVKRAVGDHVRVEADIFSDGHDELACRLLYRSLDQDEWKQVPMTIGWDDHWNAEFAVTEMGALSYRIEAWPDRFRTWQHDLQKRVEAGQDIELELSVGAALLRSAVDLAPPDVAARLTQRADALEKRDWTIDVRVNLALEDALGELMDLYGPRDPLAVYDRAQKIVVQRERARFSTWYELFPRSTAAEAGKHGTLRSLITWLPYVSQMGFDVLYLPPIHPIGRTNHKGRNNAPVGGPDDPGSPWAIGSAAGGHKAINPGLGSLADFHALVEAAHGRDIEIALDLAFQCSPDHPYVTEHPQWFKHRPDGSIRFAENPPKKYEDIYPLDFETEDWQALWLELESVVRFWVEQGVRVFRVDNPHTKPVPFWEWLLGRIKADYPDVLFLAEAFTHPRTMEYLAKLGFDQSYTYFTWRNHKWDITQYLTELTQTPVKDYLRPNFFVNTPDILHEYLQTGGRPAFMVRLILAATLSASYGIYGPPFELGVSEPREPGSEEYRDSEKYELRHWDVGAEHSLRDLIARVNRIRRENSPLQRNDTLRFLEVTSDQLVAYMKTSPDNDGQIVIVVNVDPHSTHSGWLRLPLYDLGMPADEAYEAHDLLDDAHYIWHGEWNYVELNPNVMPAHILRIRRLRYGQIT